MLLYYVPRAAFRFIIPLEQRSAYPRVFRVLFFQLHISTTLSKTPSLLQTLKRGLHLIKPSFRIEKQPSTSLKKKQCLLDLGLRQHRTNQLLSQLIPNKTADFDIFANICNSLGYIFTNRMLLFLNKWLI